MNIVFMGTPDFAVPSLKALINAGHNVMAVFTQPDKPVGRKQILTPPDVKVCALENNITVYQPERIKNSDAISTIKSLNPDVIIVVAYGKILPVEILNIAKFGCINVHASILPYYRGAAPIQWAVLNGDKETGVSIMQMDEGLDTGDILDIVKTDILPNETSAELFDRLSILGANTLINTLKKVEAGEINPQKQPDIDTEYASMITKELCPIDWSKSAQEIHNQVRGLQTWPVAITKLNGKNLKIHKSIIGDKSSAKAGEIIKCDNSLVVCCGDNVDLEILELQLDGKKRMNTKSFLMGNKIEKGTILGD